jgi:hypothetical protein
MGIFLNVQICKCAYVRMEKQVKTGIFPTVVGVVTNDSPETTTLVLWVFSKSFLI